MTVKQENRGLAGVAGGDREGNPAPEELIKGADRAGTLRFRQAFGFILNVMTYKVGL